MPSRRQRFTVLAALYVSQAVPLGFFIVALPAILRREGLGLEQVGLLGALALPWLVKFLWAPFVDRFGSRRWGHYRAWILPLQALCVLTVVLLADADPAEGLGMLLACGAAFMLFSATQDIATDGLAVRILHYRERGMGNGLQVGGYYAGQILGGGLMLVLFERVGWSTALLAMAAILAVPLVLVTQFDEPLPESSELRKTDFGAMRRFFGRPGAGVWVLTLVLYRAGDAMALTMLNPMLVDHGLSLDEIGVLIGVTISIAALAGSLLGGGLVQRLGRKRSLAFFGVLQATGICGYLLPAMGYVTPLALYPVVVLAAFAGGMATTALYTNMMDRSDPGTAATDFTLQQSLCAIGPLLGSTLSGFSAAGLGYAGHFSICAAISLTGAFVVALRLTARTAAPRVVAVGDPLAR